MARLARQSVGGTPRRRVRSMPTSGKRAFGQAPLVPAVIWGCPRHPIYAAPHGSL
jgi:hypothetical protein